MTRLTLKVYPARPILAYNVTFNLDNILANVLDDLEGTAMEKDSLAHGARVLAAWQNFSTAPDALSSVFFASAGKASPGKGTGLLSVAGEFRVEGCTVEEARKELIGILKSYWLDLLPPPLNAPLIVDVDHDELTIPGDDDIRQPLLVIGEVSAAEAATLAALIVPMPVLNQWKIKNKFTFRSLTAEELAPAFEYLRNNVPGGDPATSAGYLNPWLVGGKSNRIDPESAVMPVRECAVMWIHAGAQWSDQAVESQALAFVDGLWKALEFDPDSKTALYGCSDIQLGSHLPRRRTSATFRRIGAAAARSTSTTSWIS